MTAKQSQADLQPNARRGRRAFALAILSIVIVWGILLPRWAHQPAMRDHLEFLDQNNIDPSAMFYTDLENLDDLLIDRQDQ